MSSKPAPTGHVKLSTPAQRKKLPARHRPYWTEVTRGRHLGYRKSDIEKVGIWYGRHFVGGAYDQWRIGPADDEKPADNNKILSHHQAEQRVSNRSDAPEKPKDPGSYLVADAIIDYLKYLLTDKKSHKDAKCKLNAYIPTKLVQTPLARLTHNDLLNWRAWALTHKPVGRRDWSKWLRKALSVADIELRYKAMTKHFGNTTPPKLIATYDRRLRELRGEIKERRYGPSPTTVRAVPKVLDPEELQRRKKVNINRIINYLKAAFNLAYENGEVPADTGWKRLKKWKGVDSNRVRWLTLEEITRLANGSSPAWRKVVHVAVQTGCRWSELRGARVHDYDPAVGKLHIPKSKNYEARWIPLNQEGQAFIESITAGRSPDEPLLTDRDGNQWAYAAKDREMQAAVRNARLIPNATTHTLRHTYASHLVQAGTPLLFIAKAMGHQDTRMVEKAYGHLAPTTIDAAVRANLPSFGIAIDTKVTRLRA